MLSHRATLTKIPKNVTRSCRVVGSIILAGRLEAVNPIKEGPASMEAAIEMVITFRPTENIRVSVFQYPKRKRRISRMIVRIQNKVR